MLHSSEPRLTLAGLGWEAEISQMEVKPHVVRKLQEPFFSVPVAANRAVSGWPGNRKGMWETHC